MANQLVETIQCFEGDINIYVDTRYNTVSTDSTSAFIPRECEKNREYAVGAIITTYTNTQDNKVMEVVAKSENPFAFTRESGIIVDCVGSITLDSKTEETASGAGDGTATFSFSLGANRVWRLDGNIYTFEGAEGIFTNLSAGEHAVYAEWGDGCSTQKTFFTIGAGESAISFTYTKENASVNGVCDGSITVSVQNSSNYTFSWDDGTLTLNRTGLCAGTYILTVTDSDNGSSYQQAITITQPEKEAKPADGVFYASPVLGVRLLKDETLVSCEPVTLDSHYLAEFEHPGLYPKCYLQKYSKCDQLPIQVLSNYENNTIEVKNLQSGSVVRTVTMQEVAQFSNKNESFEGFIKRHSTGKTRVYFNASLIPVPIKVGDSVEITNTGVSNGIYAVQAKGQELNGTEYLIIQLEYTEDSPTASATVITYFSQRNYDVWEGKLNFALIAEGVYQIKVKGEDSRGAASYSSEPISVKEKHPGTLFLQYRDSKNKMDIYHASGFTNAIRFEAKMMQAANRTETTIHDEPTKAVKLDSRFFKGYTMQAYNLPPYLHEKIGAGLSMDSITIDKIVYISREGYEQEELQGRTLLSNATATIEQVSYASFMNEQADGMTDNGGIIQHSEDGFLKY